MDMATSILDGQTYTPSEISPKLAEQMLLVCPICNRTVFPVWGKKVRDHFKHHHNDDIECEWYYPSASKEPSRLSTKNGYSRNHPPILQKMLTRQFYSLIFEYTHFPEKGDLAPQHLGNTLVSKAKGCRNGAEAIKEYKSLRGFAITSRKMEESGYWDLNELAQLISVSFTEETALTTWNHLIEAELKSYQIMRAEKLKRGDMKVAEIADAAINAFIQIKDRTNSKVLQLTINFLRQRRNLPIVKDLVKLAYANAIFPESPEMMEIGYRSGWTQGKPKEFTVNTFFGELMGLYLIRLLIATPWIEFAHQYRKNLPPNQIDAIMVPQLLIPSIIVQPLRLDSE